MKRMKNNIEKIFSVLRSEASCGVAPSINEISKRQRDPFIVLISTMISSRTKDE
ncbi:MAG: endonuclease III, partial [Spirochaetes bacterium]